MPFPPINLQRISSPGRELFKKKKQLEEKDSEKEKMSKSWTTANLRNLGRKPQQQKCKLPIQETARSSLDLLTLPKQSQDSCKSVPRSSSMEATTHPDRSKQSSRSSVGKDEAGEEREIKFSLSLTPEAILVIQKRSLEKQILAKQQKGCASVDFRHRRVFPSKRIQSGSKSSTIPVANLQHAKDITSIVKISLLNDQYKYDDVEYEEEDGNVDETVVRKCKEWLKGVESASAFVKVDKRSALPHLKSCGLPLVIL